MVTQKLVDPTLAPRYLLSPYVDVRGTSEGGLLLVRRDTAKSVSLRGADQEDLMRIVGILEQGADIFKIAQWVTSGDITKAEAWLRFLIQNGVVE